MKKKNENRKNSEARSLIRISYLVNRISLRNKYIVKKAMEKNRDVLHIPVNDDSTIIVGQASRLSIGR